MVLIYPWSLLRPRHELALEVLALRHQIIVLKRPMPKPKLRRWDRCFWVMLKRAWSRWETPLMIFRPETVIGWQRAGFRMFWRWKSRPWRCAWRIDNSRVRKVFFGSLRCREPGLFFRLRSSSTVAPKTGHNLLLGLRQGAVLCSTLFQVI